MDGTFFKRWGRKVFAARWAYDGSVQGGKKVAFGNTWVVAAIVVRLSFCSSPVALPVLFRLWRGKGTASQVELAAEMLEKLAGTFPGREVHGTGDAAFHGGPWSSRAPRGRPGCRPTRCCTGPKPPPYRQAGRSRVKGDRLGTCAQTTQAANWQDAVIHVYGQEVTVQIAAADALWHGSFKNVPGRVVLVKDPGSAKAI